jgi:RHS repeat-associated protein
MKVGGQYYFYQNDHLGTPQKLTAVNGAVVWSARYSSFGKAEVDISSTITSNLRFPGQYYDQETGLHYNCQRYYNPLNGRYLSADPIGLVGGINFYCYASNTPIAAADPLGLKKILGIHSSAKPSGGFASGHAWVSVYDTDTKNIETYGLWPDDHTFFDGNGPASDVWRNRERDSKREQQRFYELTPEQEIKLVNYLNKHAVWDYENNCSDWASDLVGEVVGEEVSPMESWGYGTARTLSKSIKKLEKKNSTSHLDPEILIRHEKMLEKFGDK